MNSDDEEESRPLKKPSMFMYFLYVSVFVFVAFLLFSTFFSGELNIKINKMVSQNVEETLNCKCNIFFDNETIQTISENFTIQKYETKEFSYPMITKKKKIVIFAECYCDGEYHYEQSKAYVLEPTYNEVSIGFEFLKNNTIMSYGIQK